MKSLDRIRHFYASDIRLSLKIIATSLAVMTLAVAPLLLYVAFGPGDGNPAGVGLLALFGLFAGQLGLVAGFVCMLREFFTKR